MGCNSQDVFQLTLTAPTLLVLFSRKAVDGVKYGQMNVDL